ETDLRFAVGALSVPVRVQRPAEGTLTWRRQEIHFAVAVEQRPDQAGRGSGSPLVARLGYAWPRLRDHRRTAMASAAHRPPEASLVKAPGSGTKAAIAATSWSQYDGNWL